MLIFCSGRLLILVGGDLKIVTNRAAKKAREEERLNWSPLETRSWPPATSASFRLPTEPSMSQPVVVRAKLSYKWALSGRVRVRVRVRVRLSLDWIGFS